MVPAEGGFLVAFSVRAQNFVLAGDLAFYGLDVDIGRDGCQAALDSRGDRPPGCVHDGRGIQGRVTAGGMAGGY
jgi:hypothetical protein